MQRVKGRARRAWAWAVVSMLVVVAGVVGWLATRPAHPAAIAPARALSPPLVASAVSPPLSPSPPPALDPGWMLVAGMPVPWPPSPERLAEQWPPEWRPYLVGVQVCDLGHVKLSPSQESWLTPGQTEQAHRLLLSRSQEHADPKVRALAVFDPSAEQLMPGLARRQRDLLVRSATSSTDPQLYALALAACAASPAGDRVGCEGLSHRRWAQIDPDNAAPWFYLAGEAHRHGDMNLWHEALHRASLAPRSDTYAEQLLVATEQALPPGTPRWQRFHAQVVGMGLVAGYSFPPFSAVMAYCEAGALADANRRQLCERLAERMSEQGRNLLHVAVAAALGRALGWPPERLQALRAELYVLPRVAEEGIFDVLLNPDCPAMARATEALAQRARDGELASMRKWLEGQRMTPLQWLAAAADRQAAFEKDFAAWMEQRPGPAKPAPPPPAQR